MTDFFPDLQARLEESGLRRTDCILICLRDDPETIWHLVQDYPGNHHRFLLHWRTGDRRRTEDALAISHPRPTHIRIWEYCEGFRYLYGEFSRDLTAMISPEALAAMHPVSVLERIDYLRPPHGDHARKTKRIEIYHGGKNNA